MTNSTIEEESYYRQKQEEFNSWKNNEITKKLFKYLREKSDDCTTFLLTLAQSNVSSDIKSDQFHFVSAKIETIAEILNLDVRIFAPYELEENK